VAHLFITALCRKDTVTLRQDYRTRTVLKCNLTNKDVILCRNVYIVRSVYYCYDCQTIMEFGIKSLFHTKVGIDVQ